MASYFVKPCSKLAPYIHGFSFVELNNQQISATNNIDLFPVGCSLLSFIIDNDFTLISATNGKVYNTKLNITGQLEHYHQLITSSFTAVYVIFKPFGAHHFFSVPQNHLKNECCSLFDIIGAEAKELCQKLEDVDQDYKKVIHILEKWLFQKLEKKSRAIDLKIAQICHNIISTSGVQSIKKLNEDFGISKSSLEKTFNIQVGLSPKSFSRIVRFNQAKKLIEKNISQNWMELIDQFGYYDQSHFIHEFKFYFGYSPSYFHTSALNLANKISNQLDKTDISVN